MPKDTIEDEGPLVLCTAKSKEASSELHSPTVMKKSDPNGLSRWGSHDRLRILFLPADSIEAHISRSWHLARALAKYGDVFHLAWCDPRSALWNGVSAGSWNTLKCTIRSSTQRWAVKPTKVPHLFEVRAPIFIGAAWQRLLGPINTARFKYAFNGHTLSRLIGRLQPDIVFHADSSLFFRVKRGPHIVAWDLQDAADLALHGDAHFDLVKRILSEDLSQCNVAYAVSQAAADSLQQQLASDFRIRPLANGADFSSIRSVSGERIEELRVRHSLRGKYIATYIGGDAWFDGQFVRALLVAMAEHQPDVHLLVVGNVSRVPHPNATFVGPVSPEVADGYYRLTDVGLLLRDSNANPFLYESVPLKIVQYAAARKPVATFPVRWCEEHGFSNVLTVHTKDVDAWVGAIRECRANFQWTDTIDNEWESFTWEAVAKVVMEDAIAAQKRQSARLNVGQSFEAIPDRT